MKKQYIQLSQEDREYLEALISKREQRAKSYRRAFGLLELNCGQTYTAVPFSSAYGINIIALCFAI